MLKYKMLEGDEVEFTCDAPRDMEELGYMSYNPVLGTFTPIRTVRYKLMSTPDDLKNHLDNFPRARIVNTLAHEPFITERERVIIRDNLKTIEDVADWKRIKENGVPVIDEFGFHVYIRSDIDFEGILKDKDLRYQD